MKYEINIDSVVTCAFLHKNFKNHLKTVLRDRENIKIQHRDGLNENHTVTQATTPLLK
jgi:hypothetical protein